LARSRTPQKVARLADSGHDWITLTTRRSDVIAEAIPFTRTCWHSVDPGTILAPLERKNSWKPITLPNHVLLTSSITYSCSHLCGVAPVPASSGRTHRHRLNRGGDRAANNALYIVVLGRLRYDSRTRVYADRRTKEGLSKPEIIRCLKRYVAREVFAVLTAPTLEDPVATTTTMSTAA